MALVQPPATALGGQPPGWELPQNVDGTSASRAHPRQGQHSGALERGPALHPQAVNRLAQQGLAQGERG